MKRIAGFTYVDRHDVIRYPIREVVASALPLVEKHYVFATEPRLVAKDLAGMKGVEVVRVGFSVEKPLDLAFVQNKCLSLVREHGADFTLMLCADDVLLQKGATYLRSLVEQSPSRDWNTHGLKRECKFIFDTGTNVHGCWLGGADCKARFIEDGGYTNELGEPAQVQGPIAIGIGYLGLARAFRKIRSHSEVWKSGEGKEWISMYDSGDIWGAVKKALRRVRLYETPHKELLQAQIFSPEYGPYLASAGVYEAQIQNLLEIASEINREGY